MKKSLYQFKPRDIGCNRDGSEVRESVNFTDIKIFIKILEHWYRETPLKYPLEFLVDDTNKRISVKNGLLIGWIYKIG